MHKFKMTTRSLLLKYRLWNLNKHVPTRMIAGAAMAIALVAAVVIHISMVKAAGSATMTFTTTNGAVQVGNTLTIHVRVNTNGELVNAVQSNLTYPTAKYNNPTATCDSGGNLPNSAQADVSVAGVIKLACYVSTAGSTTTPVSGNFEFATVTLHGTTAGAGNVGITVSADDESAIVRASDSTNVLGTATGGTFTVYDPDTTGPVTSVTSPAGSSTVGGATVAVAATATDTGGSGVASVLFKLDAANDGTGGTAIGSADTTSPYGVTWNASAVSDASHKILAIATDFAGNQTVSSQSTFTVDNTGPTTTIDSGPTQSSSTTTNSAAFTFSANEGSSTFQCKLDGASFATCTSPQNLTSLSIGAHAYSIKATDPTGNVGATVVRNWTVTDGQAPTAPTNVAATAPLSTQVNVTWTAATDNVAVTGYKVYRDGVLLSAGTIGNVLTFADTTAVASTTYAYTVTARDAAGNESAASSPAASATTPATGSDTTAPTTPANARISSLRATSITFNWNASTDSGGSGLAGYKVYRGGTQIGTVAAGTLFYVDGTVSNGVSYTYTVKAYDNATLESTVSNSVVITARNMPGDIDADGRINSIDLGVILSAYGKLATVDPTANIYVANDGFPERINNLDLGLLLTDYGQPK